MFSLLNSVAGGATVLGAAMIAKPELFDSLLGNLFSGEAKSMLGKLANLIPSGHTSTRPMVPRPPADGELMIEPTAVADPKVAVRRLEDLLLDRGVPAARVRELLAPVWDTIFPGEPKS